jgi:transcriptional regulator with XRE-family HTH domain
MAGNPEFRRRVHHAFLGLQQREAPAKITQEQLAERVGKRLGRVLTQAAGQGWLAGSVPRELETMAALADELGVDTNWLYFERGQAPAGWTVETRKLPPANTQRRRITTPRKTRRASGE